ncbi:MAG: cation-transporting P-type ATPase [Methanobacteriota archaeon]|nr:MAG: cation-transporting P-type ATPase [Euryarchaeota archaeon]
MDTDFSFENPHALSIDEVVAQAKVNLQTGLSNEDVNERLQLVGKNIIEVKKPGIWTVYLAPLFDTLITIYLVMAAIMLSLSFVVPEVRGQVTFWLVVIALNMLLAIFQQYRAQKKIESLKNLSPPTAKVIRSGIKTEILAENLVVGDIIELSLGDKVPADARLISTSNFTVNEASLTGESTPVRKFSDDDLRQGLPKDTPIDGRKNMVYLGTFVQTGSATAVVVATGNRTELGSIASTMNEMHTVEIPLRSKINRLGKGLGTLMVFFLVIAIFVRLYLRLSSNRPLTFIVFAKDLTDSIVNAMAVMPINIPLLTTVVLITGVLQMATINVIVKKLSVVETLGRISVLCSDKTGTITTSKMSVVRLWDGKNYYGVIQDGTGPSIFPIENTDDLFQTNVDEEMQTILNEIDENSQLFLMIAVASRNNDATLVEQKLKEKAFLGYDVIGNPTDGALLTLLLKSGIDPQIVSSRFNRIKSYPFDSSLKRMSGLFEDTRTGKRYVFTKGATDFILPLCNRYSVDLTPFALTDDHVATILDKTNAFADHGFRVISFAYREVDQSFPDEGMDEAQERKEAESDLIFLGFSCILDPPRQGVEEAVAKLDEAGIFPVMITGDSPATAGTIAKQVGILDPDEKVVEGKDIPDLSDEDFFKVSVFARVSPQDKKVIVERYQEKGRVVAMTGDGVNDALAITLADAGVAMGITGTEVTKEAADIILADDSYVSLVSGVEEGRNLFEKIRMMIFFYIAVNFAEAIMYFSTQFLMDGSDFLQLLNNFQRTYIFSIAHAFPPLAIIFGNKDKDIMRLKPREHSELLPKNLVMALFLFGITLATSLLFIYFSHDDLFLGIFGLNSFNKMGFIPELSSLGNYKQPRNLNQAKARTMLLTVIYIAETTLVLSIRRINKNIIEGSKDVNLFILLTTFLPLAIHFMLIYIFPIQNFLVSFFGINIDLVLLGPTDVLLALFFGLLPIFVLEGYKWLVRKKGMQF